jgi:hypothetical protein
MHHQSCTGAHIPKGNRRDLPTGCAQRLHCQGAYPSRALQNAGRRLVLLASSQSASRFKAAAY